VLERPVEELPDNVEHDLLPSARGGTLDLAGDLFVVGVDVVAVRLDEVADERPVGLPEVAEVGLAFADLGGRDAVAPELADHEEADEVAEAVIRLPGPAVHRVEDVRQPVPGFVRAEVLGMVLRFAGQRQICA
jgi:hypothetical protein